MAVLLVMLLHFTLFQPNGLAEAGLFQALNIGWIGVDLFFVLSGFLITGILMDTRADPNHFKNFYARRTLRIFPLYYAYLVLLFIVLPALSADYAAEHAVQDRRIWLWTYLGNILMGSTGWEGMPSHTTHLWSLAVEEQFYMVWPLVVYFTGPARMKALCIGTFVAAIATRALLATQGEFDAGYVLTPARMDTLAAGAFMAVLLRQDGSEAVRATSRTFVAAGLLLVAAGTAWSMARGVGEFLAPLDLATQQLAYPGLALLFAALVGTAAVTDESHLVTRIFQKSWLRTLGAYSYALYMIHVPLRNIIRLRVDALGGLPAVGGTQVPAQFLLTGLGIAGSFALALISWHVFEKPILGLKKYFEPARSK